MVEGWFDYPRFLEDAETRLDDFAERVAMRYEQDDAVRQANLQRLADANPPLWENLKNANAAQLCSHITRATLAMVTPVMQLAERMRDGDEIRAPDPARARDYLQKTTLRLLAEPPAPQDSPLMQQQAAILMLGLCREAGIEILPPAAGADTARAHAMAMEAAQKYVMGLRMRDFQEDDAFRIYFAPGPWQDGVRDTEGALPAPKSDIKQLRKQLFPTQTIDLILSAIDRNAQAGDWDKVLADFAQWQWAPVGTLERECSALIAQNYATQLKIDLPAFSRQSARQL